MESHAQSVDDVLIDSLSFKLKNSASYVVDRTSCVFFPSGSNFDSSSGTKVIKVMLNASDWMDPSTVKLQFTLNNDEAKPLHPFCVGGHSLFRRFRVICGGVCVEDIDSVNRVTEMFHMMQSRIND